MNTMPSEDSWSSKCFQPPMPPACPPMEDDTVYVCQHTRVAAPISLTPRVTLGNVEAECHGEPHVECRCSRCAGSCELCVVQDVSVRIPITYEADAAAGNARVFCERPPMV